MTSVHNNKDRLLTGCRIDECEFPSTEYRLMPHFPKQQLALFHNHNMTSFFKLLLNNCGKQKRKRDMNGYSLLYTNG
jgi:hypothetical protein